MKKGLQDQKRGSLSQPLGEKIKERNFSKITIPASILVGLS